MGQGLLFGRDGALPLPQGDDERPLGDARAEVADRAWKGIDCPCCGQYAKVYKRKFHAEMAVFLCRLVSRSGRGKRWVHTRDVLRGGRETQKASTDGSYLVHWGLVEAKNEKPDEIGSGMYRPTSDGIRFVMRQIRVPSHIYMFNNEFLRFANGMVDIDSALGDGFDYEELMRC